MVNPQSVCGEDNRSTYLSGTGGNSLNVSRMKACSEWSSGLSNGPARFLRTIVIDSDARLCAGLEMVKGGFLSNHGVGQESQHRCSLAHEPP